MKPVRGIETKADLKENPFLFNPAFQLMKPVRGIETKEVI